MEIFILIFLGNQQKLARCSMDNVCKLTPVLKEILILWTIVNANNKNFALSLENAFLHKRSSLFHKAIINYLLDFHPIFFFQKWGQRGEGEILFLLL